MNKIMKIFRNNIKVIIAIIALSLIFLFLFGYNLTKEKNISPIKTTIPQ